MAELCGVYKGAQDAAVFVGIVGAEGAVEAGVAGAEEGALVIREGHGGGAEVVPLYKGAGGVDGVSLANGEGLSLCHFGQFGVAGVEEAVRQLVCQGVIQHHFSLQAAVLPLCRGQGGGKEAHAVFDNAVVGGPLGAA